MLPVCLKSRVRVLTVAAVSFIIIRYEVVVHINHHSWNFCLYCKCKCGSCLYNCGMQITTVLEDIQKQYASWRPKYLLQFAVFMIIAGRRCRVVGFAMLRRWNNIMLVVSVIFFRYNMIAGLTCSAGSSWHLNMVVSSDSLSSPTFWVILLSLEMCEMASNLV